MDKRTIIKKEKEVFYSESDGGFYYYSGIIITKINEKILELTEMECDYCAKQIVEDAKTPFKPKKLFGKFTKNGIEIENIIFMKVEYSKLKLQSKYRKNR